MSGGNTLADVNISLRKVLEKDGFIVDSYENLLLALDNNFKSHYYDLFILDIKMPEMSGFSFYREIKRLDKKLKNLLSYSWRNVLWVIF
jgi:DNA-binding response OmpR family regulator